MHHWRRHQRDTEAGDRQAVAEGVAAAIEYDKQLWFRIETRIVQILCYVGLRACVLVVSAQGQSETGSLCVAPTPSETKPRRYAPGLCAGGKLSLSIDRLPAKPWPKSESIEVGGLSTNGRHRVVVYRAGKAQQSFTFRFSEFKSKTPCLFLNDLYWTAQLWETKDAPWCKCRR